MVIRKPLVWTGNGVAQLSDSDRLLYDVDLGGNKHYRGSTVPTNPLPNDTWDEETTTGAWIRTWFWNGSFWLSTQEFWKDSSIVTLGATSVIYYDLPVDANVYVTNFKVSMLLGATNGALAYWNFALSRATGTSSSVALGSTLSTANATANAWYNAFVAVNSHISIASSGIRAFRVDVTKVGTPSNIAGAIEVGFRLARLSNATS